VAGHVEEGVERRGGGKYKKIEIFCLIFLFES